jgi:integrase
VAEPFRRQPAELLHMGSTPIPSSNDPSLYKNDLTPFLWDLKKRGYRETTIVENYAKILKHLTKNCNLNNPDSVLTYLATKDISEGRKELIVDCYANYCQWKKISFNKPRYRRIDKLPIIPLEKDIEALIAALPKKISIITRAIFETGARCGEVWGLKWVDVDFQNTALMINKPEKNSRARRLKVSAQLIGLLSTLPRKCEFVFRKHPKARLDTMEAYFIREKKKISNALCNPKIVQITWKSLRHYKATMEYARTKDILYVKELLGHVNIMNTLVYTHLVNFDNDSFVCKVAKTVEEATQLIEAGFEFVVDVEGEKLFRKRK